MFFQAPEDKSAFFRRIRWFSRYTKKGAHEVARLLEKFTFSFSALISALSHLFGEEVVPGVAFGDEGELILLAKAEVLRGADLAVNGDVPFAVGEEFGAIGF